MPAVSFARTAGPWGPAAVVLWLLALLAGLPLGAQAATLIARFDFEESSWAGVAGELKDTAGYTGGPFNGRAGGSPLPTQLQATPARVGNPGSCGYANLPGPQSNGGNFVLTALPVSLAAGAKTTVAFWMNWNGADGPMPIGWRTHDLWLSGGGLGYNTGSSDLFGIASTGLANSWRHVVAEFTNGSVNTNKIWIDGVPQVMAQRKGTPNLAAAVVQSTMQVGGWTNGNTYRFQGSFDQLRVYLGALTQGEVDSLYSETQPCPMLVHHLEIQHGSGSGLTCTPSTVTVRACRDAACSSLYTGGLSGTLSASGGMNWPDGAAFSIPLGSSSTTERLQAPAAGSVLLGTTGVSPTPDQTTSCNFGSPACNFSSADSGLLVNVPNHVSAVSQAISVSAVRKSDNALACVPAFASVSKSLNFTCAYANPASGTLPLKVGAVSLNAANNAGAACDGVGRNVSMAFNASGVASSTVSYADVGEMTLNASYTGSGAAEAGLVMSGTDNFIVAPASFAFSAITAGLIKAGDPFAATVTARNNLGATTPNFGREAPAESVTIGFTRFQPTGAGASNGSFTGAHGGFAAGSASASNLRWTEVGSIDLSASLASASYLGSGLTASGSSGAAGAVGRFIPHHFDVVATPSCGAFSYGGQPFSAQVTARNASNAITLNYDGTAATSPNFAKVVTLAEPAPLGLGSLSGASLPASAFVAGVGTGNPSYGFSSKATAPQSLALRATDTDAVSSIGFAEVSMPLRSGRLRLSNTFGQANAALQLPVVAEYWSASAWVLNSADSCSTLPAASVALSNARSPAGGATAATSTAAAITLSGGNGLLILTAPSPAGTGLSLDIALNLGSTASDQSCNAVRPASTGAARPWLRAQNGACAASADRDPAARASFGIFSPETRKTVHARELF